MYDESAQDKDVPNYKIVNWPISYHQYFGRPVTERISLLLDNIVTCGRTGHIRSDWSHLIKVGYIWAGLVW